MIDSHLLSIVGIIERVLADWATFSRAKFLSCKELCIWIHVPVYLSDILVVTSCFLWAFHHLLSTSFDGFSLCCIIDFLFCLNRIVVCILFRCWLLETCFLVLKVPTNDSMLFFLSNGILEFFTLLSGSEYGPHEGLFLVHHALFIKHLARSNHTVLKSQSTHLVCRSCVLSRVISHSLMPFF